MGGGDGKWTLVLMRCRAEVVLCLDEVKAWGRCGAGELGGL